MKRGRAAREFYARLACANAGLASPEPRLLAAFASVRRERFLGPGPWRAFTGVGYVETPGDHPDLVYRDLPFALDAARVLNNGQPSLHARALAAGELAGARTLRTDPEPDASCLFRADGWWLSSAGARAPDRDG